MQDTPTHKHTKPAVRPRLVIVLVFCLCVAMALPSTTAAVFSVARVGILGARFITPTGLNVNSKDQIVFRGLNNDSPLHIQFSSSCRDDQIKSGVVVKDGETINVSDLFNKTTSATAFAAFESIGCKEGQTVKINLQDPAPRPKNPSSGKSAPPKTDAKNSTESSDDAHAKNGTERLNSEDDDDRSVNNTQPKSGGDNQKFGGSLSNTGNRDDANYHKNDISPVVAAVVGSVASFGFASLCAVGFLIYRRRRHSTMGIAIQGGGKGDPSLMDHRNMTPQNTTPQNMTPQNTTPQNMTLRDMAPQNMTLRNMTPASSNNGNGVRPVVTSNAEAPPVYDAVVSTPLIDHDETTGLVEAEANETNHEVVLNPPNCEIVGHMAINTYVTRQ